MSGHWKDVLPVDSYCIRLADFITEVDAHVLTLLYQPLIGADAVGLFKSLVAQLPNGVYEGDFHTHQHLSLMVGLSMSDLLEARKKLEAIDLMRTYQRKSSSKRAFIYEIQPPMKPHQFFNDDVLSVFLYNKLGKNGYRGIKERFSLKQIESDAFEEVTVAFSDVFASFQHSEMQPALMNRQGDAEHDHLDTIGKDKKQGLSFHTFDFDLMKQSLSSYVVPKDVLTKERMQLIEKLAFVYQIEPLTMANLVERSIVNDELDAKNLRKTVQNWYKLESSAVAPALGLKTQPVAKRTVQAEPQSEEERVVKFYEETAPLTLLELRQEGAVVSPPDLKIIEELMVDYLLNPGVVNVLIDYNLFQNDMKLSKLFMQKIAGHWKRKKISTVPDAIHLVKTDKQKKKEGQANAASGRRNKRQDQLPKWLVQEKNDGKKQEMKKDTNSQKEKASGTADTQELADLMAERNRRRAQKGEY